MHNMLKKNLILVKYVPLVVCYDMTKDRLLAVESKDRMHRSLEKV